MRKDYVAEPVPIGDDSTTPTLCVGYPIGGGVHLVRRYRDRAGGGDEYEGVALLDDDAVDTLFEELESYREESPAYRDNDERMTDTLGDSLRNVVELDEQSAEHLRERILEEVNIPSDVRVSDEEPEHQEAPSENWTVLFLWPNEDKYITVEVLEGSHYIQVYSEDGGYSEPTYSADEVEEAIRERI